MKNMWVNENQTWGKRDVCFFALYKLIIKDTKKMWVKSLWVKEHVGEKSVGEKPMGKECR